MRIKKLQIQGFKSFADRAVLQFDSPICGVVGPNGCGKSNVIDAIKWVMGEQSARKLRGGSMQDVIFNGSEDRGPMGMAEVTLTFDNDGRGVPPEYADLAEIAVTRRLFRSGESEYLINKQPVRLRDITDLFLGTGVGSKAYAIVEQDRVAMLVNARADERRRVIEEAAGITKYKNRRAAAERKLSATEQNLARVSDITRELSRRLGSLRRQARKAERYKRLKAEAQSIDLHRMSLQYLELQALTRRDAQQLAELCDRGDRIETELMKIEASIETDRLALLDEDKRLDAAQARLYELESTSQLAEQERQHSEAELQRLQREASEAGSERQRLEQDQLRLERLHAELADQAQSFVDESGGVELEMERLSTRIEELGRLRQHTEESESAAREKLFEQRTREAELRMSLEGEQRRAADLADERRRRIKERAAIASQIEQGLVEQERLQQAVEQAREQREQLRDRLEELRAQLESAREQAESGAEQLKHAEQQLSQRRSRLESLREIEQSHAAAPQGVQDLLQAAEQGRLAGVQGVVSEALLVPEELEPAVAALLGARLQAVLVDGEDKVAEALRIVAQDQMGRVELVRSDLPPSDLDLDSRWRQDAELRVLGEAIEIDASRRPAITRLLAGAVVVPTATRAMQLQREGLPFPVVTLAGEVFAADQSVRAGGSNEAGAALLRQRREIHELSNQVEELEAQVQSLSLAQETIAERRDILQQSVEEQQSEQHELALVLVQHEQNLRGSADQQSRLHAELDRIDSALNKVARRHSESHGEIETIHHNIQACFGDVARQRLLSQAWSAEGERFEQELRDHIDRLTEVRVRVASSRERRQAAEGRLAETQAALDEGQKRLQRLEKNVERDQQEAIKRAAMIETARETAGRCASEAGRLRGQLSDDRASHQEASERVAQMESVARDSRRELSDIRGQQSELSVTQRGQLVTQHNLIERARERYQVELRHDLYDYHMLPQPGPDDEDRLTQIRRIVESMGEINLAAASEYAEIEQRHGFLSGQQDDLTHAVTQLKRAIVKIDRTTRKRFSEAFDAINQKFQQVFPRLFGGGQAHLKMVDPDDVLHTGIEIFAQPPGKKLQQVSLMSGGEKALTAISLIFSVFLIKPSPFCLLDEVDAPLDDANVGRFTELLGDISDLSQFVFISHNRHTMEVADRLYGVTMEKPGISKVVSVELRPRQKLPTTTEAAA